MRMDNKTDFVYFCVIAVILSVCTLFCSSFSRAEEVHAPEIGIELNTNKVSYIAGVIDYSTLFKFYQEETMTVDLPGDRVILISSPGGSMEVGEKMLEMIDTEKARGTRVVCVVSREASSVAFNILTHCDVRLATPGATFLVHAAEIGSLPEGQRSTARNLRKLAKILEMYDAPYRFYNAQAMHLTLKQYDEFAAQETEWSASKLLEMRYLDGYAKVSR